MHLHRIGRVCRLMSVWHPNTLKREYRLLVLMMGCLHTLTFRLKRSAAEQVLHGACHDSVKHLQIDRTAISRPGYTLLDRVWLCLRGLM